MKTASKVFIISTIILSICVVVTFGILVGFSSKITIGSLGGIVGFIIGGIVGIISVLICLFCCASIIVGFFAIRALNKATSKSKLILISILTLTMCNIIAGILMLCMSDEDLKSKKQTVNQKLRGDRIFYWAFLAYPIIHFLIFYLYVNFDSFLLAFQKYDVSSKTYNFSDPLYNFDRFFTEFSKNNVLIDGIIMNFINYAFRLFIIIPFVLYMSFVLYKKVPGTNFYRIMLYLPMMISSTVWVLLYESVSETMLPELINLISGERPYGFLSDDNTAMLMLLYFQMWYSVGGSTLMYISAMSGIPEEQVEAMKMDGAGSIREFIHLTLPSIWPILMLFLWTGVSEIIVSDMSLYTFYGDDEASAPITTFGYWLSIRKIRAAQNITDLPYVAAIGMMQSAIVLPLMFGVKKLLSKLGPKTEG